MTIRIDMVSNRGMSHEWDGRHMNTTAIETRIMQIDLDKLDS